MRCLQILAAALVLVSPLRGQDGSFGHFEGRVITEWLPDGRRMRLVESFAYVDPTNVRWEAPKDSIVDGASIPRMLWTIIGGPFEGRYRNASVLHDVACVRRDHAWRDVHRMLYNSMRLAAVSALRAKIMYGAVYHFGPRWGADSGVRVMRSEEDAMRMRQYIEERPTVTLSRIEELSSGELQKLHPVIRPEMLRPPNDTTGF